MAKLTLTTTQAIDNITNNLDGLDGDAIAHLYELVFGGSATGIDGGLEWEPEVDLEYNEADSPKECVDTVMQALGYKSNTESLAE